MSPRDLYDPSAPVELARSLGALHERLDHAERDIVKALTLLEQLDKRLDREFKHVEEKIKGGPSFVMVSAVVLPMVAGASAVLWLILDLRIAAALGGHP